MAVVDRHDVAKGLYALLAANGTIQTLLGNPPRIYVRPPRNASFPWVRVDFLPASPWFGVCGDSWVRQVMVQFTAFAVETTLDTVAAIQAAIINVMDAAVGSISITNGNLRRVLPGTEAIDFDENNTAYSVTEYTLSVQYAAA